MGDFCQFCGQELRGNGKFCSRCGKAAKKDSLGATVLDGVKTILKRRIIVYFCVLLPAMLLIGFIGSFFFSKSDANNSVQPNTVLSTQDKAKQGNTAAAAKETPIYEAQKALEKSGILGTVLATSKGKNSDKGFLSIVRKDGENSFIISDQANKQIAHVPFSVSLYNFPTNHKSKPIPPIIFPMTIFNDHHDRDEKDGIWHGAHHLIPIYASYSFNEAGDVIPGMITTGWGENPSHYQGHLMEQKNVDLVNLFLSEMNALRRNVTTNQIAIPAN